MKRSMVARIFDPVTPRQLAEDYFERRPLHVRGRPGKYDFLFRQEQFKDRLRETTEVRAVFGGLWQATIDPADIKEMYRAGATICVTGMERAHPALARAARAIARELHYPGGVSFRAYLSPAGRGFDLHYDARIATTLQIAGVKRWWYSPTPAIAFPRANSARAPAPDARPKPPGLRALRSVVLRPGDLLCLPAGTWHRARAQSDCLALNLAFDHNAANVIGALAEAVKARLDADEAWRRPPRISSARRRLTSGAAAELRARIDRVVRELDAIRDDPMALEQLWRGFFT